MLKSQAAAHYAAYAELESAAEAFYAAAQRMSELVPALNKYHGAVCDEVNAFVVAADFELDEVL